MFELSIIVALGPYPQLYPSKFWIAVMRACCWSESGGKLSIIEVSIRVLVLDKHIIIQKQSYLKLQTKYIANIVTIGEYTRQKKD